MNTILDCNGSHFRKIEDEHGLILVRQGDSLPVYYPVRVVTREQGLPISFIEVIFPTGEMHIPSTVFYGHYYLQGEQFPITCTSEADARQMVAVLAEYADRRMA